jgi:hypothetical protein
MTLRQIPDKRLIAYTKKPPITGGFLKNGNVLG